MKRFVVVALCLLVGHVLLDVSAVLVNAPTIARAQVTCDRACLEGIAEQYLDALVAKDPKTLPASAGVKYTENGQRLMLGDGFWNSVTGRGTYKLHIADQTGGQIVTFSTMREAGTPVIIAVRLKIDASRRLTEVETLIAHSEAGAKNLETIGQPRGVPACDTSGGSGVSCGTRARRQHVFQRHAAERRQGKVSVRE